MQHFVTIRLHENLLVRILTEPIFIQNIYMIIIVLVQYQSWKKQDFVTIYVCDRRVVEVVDHKGSCHLETTVTSLKFMHPALTGSWRRKKSNYRIVQQHDELPLKSVIDAMSIFEYGEAICTDRIRRNSFLAFAQPLGFM